jgi:type I restriction enzyme, S subunit
MELNLKKSNWRKVRFGDVVKKVTNRIDPNGYDSDIVIQGGHINKRDFHIREYENKKELGYLGPAFHMGFKKNQILYVSRNPHLMKVGYPQFDGICANTTYIMETKNNQTLRNDLVPFIMHSDTFIEQSVANVRGGVNPYVNWGDISCIEFLLPPIDQQKNLAKLLWAIDDLIESKIDLLSKLKIQCKAEEKKAFNKGLNSKLEEVILRTLSGGTPDTKKIHYYNDGEIPWVTSKALVGDRIGVGEKFVTHKAVSESAAKILSKGNILAGTRVGVGKFSINNVDISFSQDITGLEINKEAVDIEFLVHQLNSKVFQARIQPFVRGTTIKGITKDDLLALKIFLPDFEQQKIIRIKLQSIKNSIQNVIVNIELSKTLKKILINQIF